MFGNEVALHFGRFWVVEDVVGGFGPREGVAAVVNLSMKRRMAAVRSLTLVKLPRRMAWRVTTKKISEDFDHVQPGPAGRALLRCRVVGTVWCGGA